MELQKSKLWAFLYTDGHICSKIPEQATKSEPESKGFQSSCTQSCQRTYSARDQDELETLLDRGAPATCGLRLRGQEKRRRPYNSKTQKKLDTGSPKKLAWKNRAAQPGQGRQQGTEAGTCHDMKNEANKSLQITLLHSEELLTGNKAANHFISQYTETSNLQVPAERTKEIRETQETYRGNQGPFTCKELEDALSSMKQKKSTGPD